MKRFFYVPRLASIGTTINSSNFSTLFSEVFGSKLSLEILSGYILFLSWFMQIFLVWSYKHWYTKSGFGCVTKKNMAWIKSGQCPIEFGVGLIRDNSELPRAQTIVMRKFLFVKNLRKNSAEKGKNYEFQCKITTKFEPIFQDAELFHY